VDLFFSLLFALYLKQSFAGKLDRSVSVTRLNGNFFERTILFFGGYTK
jgi:hypothetical protein